MVVVRQLKVSIQLVEQLSLKWLFTHSTNILSVYHVTALYSMWKYISKEDCKISTLLLPFLVPAFVTIVSSLSTTNTDLGHILIYRLVSHFALEEWNLLTHQTWDLYPPLKKRRITNTLITLINNGEALFSREEFECFYQTMDVNLEEKKNQLKLQNPNSGKLNEEISPENK